MNFCWLGIHRMTPWQEKERNAVTLTSSRGAHRDRDAVALLMERTCVTCGDKQLKYVVSDFEGL